MNLFCFLPFSFVLIAFVPMCNVWKLSCHIIWPHVLNGYGFTSRIYLIGFFLFFPVSGLSGTTETAQSQVSVGMGLLAGSTVMLLTVIWGSCVVVGRCDLRDSVAVDGTITKGFSLTGVQVFSTLYLAS